jgi:hypothetical protein
MRQDDCIVVSAECKARSPLTANAGRLHESGMVAVVSWPHCVLSRRRRKVGKGQSKTSILWALRLATRLSGDDKKKTNQALPAGVPGSTSKWNICLLA